MSTISEINKRFIILGTIFVVLGSASFLAGAIILSTFKGVIEPPIVNHLVAFGAACLLLAFLMIPLQRESKFTNWLKKPILWNNKGTDLIFLGIVMLITLGLSPKSWRYGAEEATILLYIALFLIVFGWVIRIRLSKRDTPKNDS